MRAADPDSQRKAGFQLLVQIVGQHIAFCDDIQILVLVRIEEKDAGEIVVIDQKVLVCSEVIAESGDELTKLVLVILRILKLQRHADPF